MSNRKVTPKVRLANLAHVLRDKSQWPDGFDWEYSDCRRCAMGLASKIGIVAGISDEHLCKQLGLTRVQVSELFGLRHVHMRKYISEVTPEDVADAIDEVLANK